MITCPNCDHQNPDGALQCEACYTPLPALATCPNCRAPVQANASFCGQCGHDLRDSSESTSSESTSSEPINAVSNPSPDEPPEATSESFSEFSQSINFDESVSFGGLEATANPVESTLTPENESSLEAESEIAPPAVLPVAAPAASAQTESSVSSPPALDPIPTATQIQTPSASLKHVQTQTSIPIPDQLSIVRIGKPNDHTPPDIDVSGFPDSEIVSRVHANLLVEDNTYYLEDKGSSNGTYINGLPLPKGNRHRLNTGDRIAFGKGDKVSFIFEAARY